MATKSPEEVDAARVRLEARVMSDGTLRRLHAQGAANLRPGTWEILDVELEQRRDTATLALTQELEIERYPALRIVIVVFKAFAVLVLMASLIAALFLLKANPAGFQGFRRFDLNLLAGLVTLAGTWVAITWWAAAELLAIQIDIEANTRALRHPVRTIAQ